MSAENFDQQEFVRTSPVYGPGAASCDMLQWSDIVHRNGQFSNSSAAFLDSINTSFRHRYDDVWVVSYPKTGTTWCGELVKYIISDYDAKKVAEADQANEELLIRRFEIMIKGEEGARKRLDAFDQLGSPRLFIAHLNEPNLPPAVFSGNYKVVVPLRNPKDAAVSYYHFHRANKNLGQFTGSFSTFLKEFVDGRVVDGSIYDFYLPMWERHLSPLMFIHYEDLQANTGQVLDDLAAFLGRAPPSGDQRALVLAKTSFHTMKQNSALAGAKTVEHYDHNVSPFFRKGKSGDWRNHFTVAESEVFDVYHAQRLKNSSLKFRET